jgi:Cu-Zn family superoxide dismutase
MKKLLPFAIAALFVAGCATKGPVSGATASATLESTKGNSAKGTVTFTQVGDKVRVSANLYGLKPDAEHGFHMHEKGDCSSGDGMSAGGHYNPASTAHGAQATDHHAGDMPNVKSDSYGNAGATFELPGLSIGPGAADIVGKGLIVHRDPDDYKSQPAGNAGPRIACAVIKLG